MGLSVQSVVFIHSNKLACSAFSECLTAITRKFITVDAADSRNRTPCVYLYFCGARANSPSASRRVVRPPFLNAISDVMRLVMRV